MDLNRTTLTALALGFSIAAITAAPIPYSTTHVITEGDSPAVIAEKAAKVLPRPNQTAWMLLERTFFLHFGEKPVSAATKLTAKCDVPYQPGELRAIGLVNGKVVAKTALKTIGPAKELRLTADRKRIRVDRNDLACVTVEVVDANGRRVPNAEMPVRFSVSGAGELADQASSGPNDATSFRAPIRKTYEGPCLAILRPKGGSGKITLNAEADRLKPATIIVRAR